MKKIFISKKRTNNKMAQATLEFVFAFVVLILILYGSIKALQWLGLSLGGPVQRHYEAMYSWSGAASSDTESYNPVDQLTAADKASDTLPGLQMVFNGQLVNP